MRNKTNMLNAMIISSIISKTLYRCGDGDDDGDGDTPTMEIDVNSEAFKTALKIAVDDKTKGISAKNSELIGKLKKSKEDLTAFGDYDPQKVRDIFKNIEESQEAKLISEGKMDEVFAKKTDSMRALHEQAFSELTEKYETEKTNGASYKQKYESKVIYDCIKTEALKQGVLPQALGDIANRASSIFVLDVEGNIEARNTAGELMKNSEGALVNAENFVKGLQKDHSYYWAPSSGTGAAGNIANNVPQGDQMQMLEHLAQSGKTEEYRALSKKIKEAQGGKSLNT